MARGVCHDRAPHPCQELVRAVLGRLLSAKPYGRAAKPKHQVAPAGSPSVKPVPAPHLGTGPFSSLQPVLTETHSGSHSRSPNDGTGAGRHADLAERPLDRQAVCCRFEAPGLSVVKRKGGDGGKAAVQSRAEIERSALGHWVSPCAGGTPDRRTHEKKLPIREDYG